MMEIQKGDHNMALDLSSLRKALNSLERAVNFAVKKESENSFDKEEKEIIIAGVIQNFEFTYELCWKYMKRWLEMNISSDIVDGVPRKELFRRAAESRLIDEIEKWFKFHNVRNKTSHIYNESIAGEVYLTTKEFLPEAQLFYKRIEERND